MNKKQTGFTLIELMITVAIIGILAAIALPAYQTYIKKARFAEVILAADALRKQVEACAVVKNLAVADFNSKCSSEISTTGLNAGKEVASVQLGNDGSITATGDTSVDSKTYIMSPTKLASGGYKWTINSTSTCLTAGLCSTN